MDGSADILSGVIELLSNEEPPLALLISALIRAPPARISLLDALARRLLAIHRIGREADASTALSLKAEVSALSDLSALFDGNGEVGLRWRQTLWSWCLNVLQKIEKENLFPAVSTLDERYNQRVTESVCAAVVDLAARVFPVPSDEPARITAAEELLHALSCTAAHTSPDIAANGSDLRNPAPLLLEASAPTSRRPDPSVQKLLFVSGCLPITHAAASEEKGPATAREDDSSAAAAAAAAAVPDAAGSLDWLAALFARISPRPVVAALLASALRRGAALATLAAARSEPPGPTDVVPTGGAGSPYPEARALDAVSALRPSAVRRAVAGALELLRSGSAATAAGGMAPAALFDGLLHVAAHCPAVCAQVRLARARHPGRRRGQGISPAPLFAAFAQDRFRSRPGPGRKPGMEDRGEEERRNFPDGGCPHSSLLLCVSVCVCVCARARACIFFCLSPPPLPPPTPLANKPSFSDFHITHTHIPPDTLRGAPGAAPLPHSLFLPAPPPPLRLSPSHIHPVAISSLARSLLPLPLVSVGERV